MSDIDAVAVADPVEAAEPAAEERTDIFAEAFGDDPDSSSAKEKVTEDKAATVKDDAPQKSKVPEAHPQAADEKDREIESLRNKLNGVLPRYNALQKAHEARLAQDKERGPALSPEKKASIEEYGELGQEILELRKQLEFLQDKTAGVDEVVADVKTRREIEAEAAQRAAEAQIDQELTKRHADWKEVKASKEFKAWANNLPAEDKEVLFNTNSPRAFAGFLSDFKEATGFKSTKQPNVADIQAERQRRKDFATAPDSRTSSADASGNSERATLFDRAFNSG